VRVSATGAVARPSGGTLTSPPRHARGARAGAAEGERAASAARKQPGLSSQDPRNIAPEGAPEAFPRRECRCRPGHGAAIAGQAAGSGVARGRRAGRDASFAPEEGGYSVQIFAGGVRNAAELQAREAAARFSEAVRVDLEEGIFKVRVASGADRAQAATLLQRARALGYRDAFLVATGGPGKDEGDVR